MSTPQSLKGRYQLVAIVPHEDTLAAAHAAKLLGAVRHAFGMLGVNATKFLSVVSSENSISTIDRKMPTVGVFFATGAPKKLPPSEVDKVRQLLVDGYPIIPVVDDMSTFSTLVPQDIAHLNGLSVAMCGAEFDRLAAYVLESFGLLRQRRRLFISYRRVETTGVAAQLYEALSFAGFDVFIDTHGIVRPGEEFQEVLWHRLADTDVTVLLDSPDFLSSRWTEEELAKANNSNIQLLQILWPGQTENAAAAFSMFHPLEESDFIGPERLGSAARLADACISTIVDEIEGLRARAIAARHSFLVREFLQEARAAGIAVYALLDRQLVLKLPNGKRLLVRPCVGIPDAEGYESLERQFVRELENSASYIPPPVLLYDQTGLRVRWREHLSWLDRNLQAVRGVSLEGARAWLDTLKTASKS